VTFDNEYDDTNISKINVHSLKILFEINITNLSQTANKELTEMYVNTNADIADTGRANLIRDIVQMESV
jgi:hypothetical protein